MMERGRFRWENGSTPDHAASTGNSLTPRKNDKRCHFFPKSVDETLNEDDLQKQQCLMQPVRVERNYERIECYSLLENDKRFWTFLDQQIENETGLAPVRWKNNQNVRVR